MDSNNWRPNPPGGEPAVDAGDWRTQLQPDSRQRIVNKIMETLKRHLPFSGQEGLNELKKIAVRFEEKIYTAATSQSDYLRKISLKMLTMETKSQANPLQSNSAGNSNKPPDPASHGMPSQVHNQGQSLPLPLSTNQSQAPQQLLNQNIQNNIASAGVQSSAGLPSSMPPGSSLTQTPVPNVVGQNSNMQSISGISQNSVGNSMGQGMPSNMFANSQRQMQGRQQVLPQQPQQQSLNPQQYLYQQQIQQQLMKQKLQQGNLQHSIMQSDIQQQQHQINDVSDLKMGLHLLSLNTQNNIASADVQSFRGLPSDVFPAIASPDSMAQMGHANEDDWKEEVYQKIKAMKEMYLPELNEMYQKIAAKLQQHDSLPQQPKSEQLEKLKVFKTMLERIITFLQVSKESVLPGFKEKLGSYEKQIMNFINTNRPGKAVSSLPQGQLPPPQGPLPPSQMHSMQQPQSQITQLQSHEIHMRPLMQSMILQQEEQQCLQTQQIEQLEQLQLQKALLLRQLMVQHQQQQLYQKAKQHLPEQLQSHQVPQLHQINDVNDSKTGLHLLSLNTQNNIASADVQSFGGLPSDVFPAIGITQSPMSNTIGQNSNMQNISSMAQNSVMNSMGQGVPSNIFASSPRLMHGMQENPHQQPPQQFQNPQGFLFQQQQQQQLQKALLKHKFEQQQQQKQNLSQPTKLQQSGMQTSSVMQASVMQSAPLTTPQQQPQQADGIHQQQLTMPPQQQQLLGRYSGNSNMQTNQHSIFMLHEPKNPLKQMFLIRTERAHPETSSSIVLHLGGCLVLFLLCFWLYVLYL